LVSDTWALGVYSCHKNGQQVDEEESDENDNDDEEE
jgi:hypothetical protein